MPKDLKGKELPKGIYQRKDGRYEARALVNGIKVQLYNFNLKELKEAFESVKEKRVPVTFEDVYPHAIRHTFCSRCFQLNMQPKVVQKLMGHQHYSTTIDIYTHVMQDDIDTETAKLESAIIETE